MKAGKEVIRASGVISLLTLLSRCLGLVRDMLMAALLGTGWVAGAFQLAWVVPNLLRRLLGEGALTSAFVPLFTRSGQAGDPAGPRRFLAAALGTLAMLLILLAALGLAVLFLLPLPWWAALFDKPGLVAGQEYARHFRLLLALLLPYLVPVCLLALVAGALQCRGRFALPAAAPLLLNLVWIAALLLGGWVLELAPRDLTLLLALALVMGGVLQLLMQLPLLRREGLLVRPRLAPQDRQVRRLALDMAPVAVGLALFQVNTLLDQVIAVTMVEREGPNTFLFYANRLFQFPLALVGTAMAVASLPRMSALAAAGKQDEVARVYGLTCRTVLFFALPAAAGLALLAEPIISLLFLRGRFTQADAGYTAQVLLFLAAALPFVCLSQVASRLHYALDDRRTPVRIGLVLMVVNLGLNLLLVGPLGVPGLAAATAATALVQALWLHTHRTRLGLPSGVPALGSTLARLVPATAVMAGGVLGVKLAGQALGWGSALSLFIPLGAGLFLYLGLAALCRFPELKLIRGG